MARYLSDSDTPSQQFNDPTQILETLLIKKLIEWEAQAREYYRSATAPPSVTFKCDKEKKRVVAATRNALSI